MLPIGESIHIIKKTIREAVDNRDKDFIQDLAKRQVEGGAKALDLNMGPMKKRGAETMEWMVDTVQEVTDVRLSLDTSNAEAMEAGLAKCKQRAIINSTNADPERMKVLMPMAAKYNADLICLTLRRTGLPVEAEQRVEIATDDMMPAAMEYGLPFENIIFDPLVLTVDGTQDHGPNVVRAASILKQLNDPPFKLTCGLSNVSNGHPEETRYVLNCTYLAMLMGAGMDCPIVDTLDSNVMETMRIVEERDDSTPAGKLYIALHDAIAEDEEFDTSMADMNDPDQSNIVKAYKILEDRMLYAHDFLRL
ncbi:MAG: dihydropteroate synthase [Chloroflexota bacterium]